VAKVLFWKKCHKKCGKNFILKNLPQKVWQKNRFEKFATKKVANFLL